MKLNEAEGSSAEIKLQMEEEGFGFGVARFLLGKLVLDAESVQSGYDARFIVACSEAEAQDRFLVHRPKSASFGYGLGCFLSGRGE